MDTSIEDRDYSQIDRPFIIRSANLSSWPCFRWTLEDWSLKCGETMFPFRIHRRDSENFWETEAIDRFNTIIKHYAQWVKSDAKDCDQNNPFRMYPKSQFWVYSSYNYMDKLLGHIPEVIDSVDWSKLDLGLKLNNNAKNSTLWMGSDGAFTPCHQDSYGYNFVAQISGKKQWILFPPTDTNNLYPTRIPYEESSVFSSVHFQKPNYRSHPLFRQTSPHIIELSAGDVLFVPHLWWHFVRVTEEESEKSCISINTWIFNDCFESSLNESIVRLLTTTLFQTLSPTQPSKWLNTNADLFTAEEALNSINLMLRKCNSVTKSAETPISRQQVVPKSAQIIESSIFDEFEEIMFTKNVNKRQKTKRDSDELTVGSDRQDLTPEAVLNCVLHPDVIQLIAQKLVNLSLNQ